MAKAQAVLDLRPATIADAERVADLETARTPDDPRDPELLRFSWTAAPAGEVFTRMVAERDGSAIAYLYAGHMHWEEIPERFGSMRVLLHPKNWTDASYEQLVDAGESWVRAEGGEIGVVRVRENIKNEIRILEGMGYRELRRGRALQHHPDSHLGQGLDPQGRQRRLHQARPGRRQRRPGRCHLRRPGRR